MTFSIPTLQHTNFGRLENLAPVFDSISEKYQALSHEQQIWLWIASIAGFILMIGGVVYLISLTLRSLNNLLQSPDGWRPINTKNWMWVGSGVYLLILAYQTRAGNHAGWSVPAAGGIVVITGFVYYLVRRLKILRAIGAFMANACIGAILAPIVIHSIILIVVLILICVALWISALFESRRVVYVEYR
jgi:hypothetical protein